MCVSGVHSALHHDKILMSASPDYAILEAEAEHVARRAAHALKQSRIKCQRGSEPGVPTWTGQHGSSGAPVYRSKQAYISIFIFYI